MIWWAEEFYHGAWGTIAYAKGANGALLAKEFFHGCQPEDKAKLRALFVRLADHSTIPNRQKFRQVEGAVFEVKSHQIRISCYRSEDVWYLLHGFVKKQDRWPKQEVERAVRLMREHQAQK
jgi:phage-related protein